MLHSTEKNAQISAPLPRWYVLFSAANTELRKGRSLCVYVYTAVVTENSFGEFIQNMDDCTQLYIYTRRGSEAV